MAYSLPICECCDPVGRQSNRRKAPQFTATLDVPSSLRALLGAQTVYGSAKLLLGSGGLRRTLIDAVEAATNPSAQLGEIMAAR